MTANCPKCRREKLALATEGENPPLRCPKCFGMWFEDADAQQLLESDTFEQLPTPKESATDRSLDNRVGMCPYGHAILTRAKVDVARPFHLDRCHKCGGIWFDAGEWARLASQRNLRALRDLWKPVLKQQLEQAQELAAADDELKLVLGDDIFEQLEMLAEELRDHTHRDAAIDFLQKRTSPVRLVTKSRKKAESSEPEPPDDVA